MTFSMTVMTERYELLISQDRI